jgi:predicted  nucleic acid-binding Zn-ribbon protein
MAKIVSLNNRQHQKRLALESKLADINKALEALSEKENALREKRSTLEKALYTPEELAKINVTRRAKKLTW